MCVHVCVCVCVAADLRTTAKRIAGLLTGSKSAAVSAANRPSHALSTRGAGPGVGAVGGGGGASSWLLRPRMLICGTPGCGQVRV